jgi:hypothetical protein
MELDLQAVIGQLQQQLQAQQIQLEQQQKQQILLTQHAQQQQQQQNQISPPSLSSTFNSSSVGRLLVKPKPPSTFNAGEKVGELDQWEREMRYQFVAYGAALSAARQQIAFAVSYLGSVPLQWWDADPSHQHVQSWEEFVALLRGRFRPVHAAKQARTELFRIVQGSSQTAGAYASRFQELLVSLPDMHVDDQVFLFIRGLQPKLKRRIGDREFASLSVAINAAVQSEGLYGIQSGESSEASPASHTQSDSSSDMEDVNAMRLKLAAMELQLTAMHYGAARSNTSNRHGERSIRDDRRSGWVTGVSQEQVASRRANGECIRCGSKKHFKNNCPQKDDSHDE